MLLTQYYKVSLMANQYYRLTMEKLFGIHFNYTSTIVVTIIFQHSLFLEADFFIFENLSLIKTY